MDYALARRHTRQVYGSEIDQDLYPWLNVNAIEVHRCGSRVTCDPPPTDTDADYLIRVSDFAYGEELIELGFMPESSAYSNTFKSYRRGILNLIVCKDVVFYEKHRLATHVCQRLNIMDKDHRIVVFQAILYGNVK